MTRIADPLRAPEDHFAVTNRAVFQDQLEQVYAVLETRGVPPGTVTAAWVRHHLKAGKTPLEVADIAVPPQRRLAPDAHLGGIDA